MDKAEFTARAYEVMRHIFEIHGELGRLFHEKIFAQSNGSTSRAPRYSSRRFGKENE